MNERIKSFGLGVSLTLLGGFLFLVANPGPAHAALRAWAAAQ